MAAFDSSRQRGLLAWVERVGNKLPDPAMIFVWLIIFLMMHAVPGGPFTAAQWQEQSRGYNPNVTGKLISMPSAKLPSGPTNCPGKLTKHSPINALGIQAPSPRQFQPWLNQ